MEHADEEVAQRRAEIIAELQSRIMDEYNAARVGTVMEVLCEGEEPDLCRLARYRRPRTVLCGAQCRSR